MEINSRLPAIVVDKMLITEKIQKELKLKIEPEVSDPTKRWHCFDSGSAEIEVLEFLYALVRLMKPENIFETGSNGKG